MQLQTHGEAFRNFLGIVIKIIKEIIKDIDKDYGGALNLSARIDDEIPTILKSIFSNETEELKNALLNACNSIQTGISRSQDYFKSSIVRILESTFRARSGELEETKPPRDFIQPLIDTIGEFMKNLVVAMDLFSRKSFEAAYLVAFKLKEIEERETWPINVRARDEDRRRIYPVWASLADKGHNLLFRIPDFDNVLGDLLNLLNGMCKKIKNEKEVFNAIFDAIYKRDRKNLSGLVYNALNADRDFKTVVVEYVVEHLLMLGEQLHSVGELTTENVKAYLETVFENKCFLEYEVYTALLEHAVPALPRLIISATDTSGELDVVACIGGKLWLVEVTTGKDLEDKAEKLSGLMSRLGAEKTLIVCTKEALEISKQIQNREEVEFLSFGELCNKHKLQKLLKASTRR